MSISFVIRHIHELLLFVHFIWFYIFCSFTHFLKLTYKLLGCVDKSKL